VEILEAEVSDLLVIAERHSFMLETLQSQLRGDLLVIEERHSLMIERLQEQLRDMLVRLEMLETEGKPGV